MSRLINPSKPRTVYLLSILLPGLGQLWYGWYGPGALILFISTVFWTLTGRGLLVDSLSTGGLITALGFWLFWAVIWTVQLKYIEIRTVKSWPVTWFIGGLLLVANLLLAVYWMVILIASLGT